MRYGGGSPRGRGRRARRRPPSLRCALGEEFFLPTTPCVPLPLKTGSGQRGLGQLRHIGLMYASRRQTLDEALIRVGFNFRPPGQWENPFLLLRAPSLATAAPENSYDEHHCGWASDLADLSPSQEHLFLLLLGAPSPSPLQNPVLLLPRGERDKERADDR